jgi:hypothetical protein
MKEFDVWRLTLEVKLREDDIKKAKELFEEAIKSLNVHPKDWAIWTDYYATFVEEDF